MQTRTNTQWHTTNWGFWGWLETAAKAVGLGGGLIAFSQSEGAFDIGLNARLFPTLLLAGMTLGTLIALVFRYHQREIISMGFAVLNVLGHGAAFIALLRVPEDKIGLILLGGMYALGELTKQIFLTKTGYTEAGQTSANMLNASRGVMALYLIFTAALLFA